MRIVVDTSVWVRYLLRPSRATRDIVEELWPSDSVKLIVSPEVLSELQDVLHRPKIRRFVAPEDASALVDAVKSHSLMLALLDPIPPFTRDRKDDKFVACALSGNAEHLITYDQDLLVLGAVGNIQISTPEMFVRKFSSHPSA